MPVQPLNQKVEPLQPLPVSWRHSPLEVRVDPLPLDLLNPALGVEASNRLAAALAIAARALAGRTIWMVNSTAAGGGVAELLRALLPYWSAGELDVRLVVLRAPSRFFTVTKRLHNWLHGDPGDGGELGEGARRIYEGALAPTAERLVAEVRPRDLVVLHDPQTAGLTPALAMTGARVVWRSHVGADHSNELTRAAWNFLADYVGEAAALVFTRMGFIPPQLARMPVSVIPPCIDPCATKNRRLATPIRTAILAQAGIAFGDSDEAPALVGRDGRRILVRRSCAIRRDGPAPRLGRDRLVVHLARWDRLKDPIGVIDCFAGGVLERVDAHLMLAGPGVRAVADDPEAVDVYRDVEAHWGRLRAGARRRIHLLRLPMRDLEENAAIVNALQGHADVVVKKSLEEGFGLGVTEAMWKQRPVVASAVGGHREQIEDGLSGVLIPDPRDMDATGAAIAGLIADPTRAQQLGIAAQRRVRRCFLPDHHLAQWLTLLTAVARTSSRRDAHAARWRGSATPSRRRSHWVSHVA
jgi:trehalose synthase